MWVLVLLLNLLGRKNFLRFLAGWMLIMVFFLYCFVHDAFDQPRPSQRLDDCSVNNYTIQISSVLYFHRNWTGSALISS